MLAQEHDFSPYYHSPEDTLAHLNPPYLAEAARAVAATVGHLAVRTATPTLSIDSAEVVEGDSGQSDALFTVTLAPAAAETVTVSFATADETATAGADYLASSGSITFAPGETSHTIAVPVLGDTEVEDLERFSVLLSEPIGAALGDRWGTGTIVPDEHELRVSSVSVWEGDAGQHQAVFSVSLWPACSDTPCPDQVTVSYATQDGGASAGR